MKRTIISKTLFLCTFFLFSCSKQKLEIPPENQEKIQAFLNDFLFANGAVYTLFGDKPISEVFLFTGNEDDLAELTEEEEKTAICLDPSIRSNWTIWKQYARQIQSNYFILAEHPCSSDPSHTIYSIMNIEKTKKILKTNQKDFIRETGVIFNPETVVFEFQKNDSFFWKKVLQSHYLSGLLFGYGKENIEYFLDSKKTEYKFSDEYNPSANCCDFPIPIFMISPKDQTASNYRKQREKIRRIYENKDVIEVTLKRLSE